MPDGRLEVTDALGRRVIHIDKPVFSVGRRSGNDLQLVGSDVSRDHAEIALDGGQYILRDRGSRYGTFVNGEAVTEHPLKHGDLVRLGRSGGAELVFLLEDAAARRSPPTSTRRPPSATSGRSRRCSKASARSGSGRVLDEVLALVMDSAIEVTGAERGFIMLAGADNEPRVQARPRPRPRDAARQRASRPAARFPRRCSRPARRRSSPTCSTATSPTCTWAPSRSASATCSARR